MEINLILGFNKIVMFLVGFAFFSFYLAQNDQIHFSVNKYAPTTSKNAKNKLYITIGSNSDTNVSLQRFPNFAAI